MISVSLACSAANDVRADFASSEYGMRLMWIDVAFREFSDGVDMSHAPKHYLLSHLLYYRAVPGSQVLADDAQAQLRISHLCMAGLPPREWKQLDHPGQYRSFLLVVSALGTVHWEPPAVEGMVQAVLVHYRSA